MPGIVPSASARLRDEQTLPLTSEAGCLPAAKRISSFSWKNLHVTGGAEDALPPLHTSTGLPSAA